MLTAIYAGGLVAAVIIAGLTLRRSLRHAESMRQAELSRSVAKVRGDE